MFSIIVVVILLLLRLWILGGIILAFAFVLNWRSEAFALHLVGENNENSDFRILTYNINRAHEISVNKGTSEQLINFILQQNADLILLQEYNVELYPEVQERLGKTYPYGSGIESTSRFKSVFSKFPIETYEQLTVDANNPRYELFQKAIYCKKEHDGLEILPICKMKIRVGQELLQVFNCHLMSNNYSVVIRNLRKKRKSLFRSVWSVLYRMNFGYQARDLQAKVISSYIDSSVSTLICGDFNDVCGSSTLNILQRLGLSDAWWKGGFGFGFTFHGMGLRFRLDHVLFSRKDLRLTNVSVPHSDISDHDPVVCDFTII